VEKRRPLRRQNDDHHFRSLLMLAFGFPARVFYPLKAGWQKQMLASSGYCELGMFEDAAQALEEIEPEDKTRNEVLYARVDIYLAAKKWNMADSGR
jgi:hypothetical protein